MCATHPDPLEPGDPVTTLMYEAMDEMSSFVYDPLWREKRKAQPVRDDITKENK